MLAQKLLFAHTEAGDLTALIRDYFDTNIGAKRDAESYRRIAHSLACAPSEIVFISDVVAELDAARSAGFQTLLCERPGNHPQPASSHTAIRTFDEVFLSAVEWLPTWRVLDLTITMHLLQGGMS